MKDGGDFALGLTAAGGLLGAVGEYQAGQTDAAVAANNAQISRRQARDALVRGGFNEDQINRIKGEVISHQRTAFASQGVALDEGTPLAVQEDTERQAQMDVLTARNNAALEALGFRQAASGYRYESRVGRRKGESRAAGALLGAGADYYKISKMLGD